MENDFHLGGHAHLNPFSAFIDAKTRAAGLFVGLGPELGGAQQAVTPTQGPKGLKGWWRPLGAAGRGRIVLQAASRCPTPD